jgi:N-methylhydantoinase B
MARRNATGQFSHLVVYPGETLTFLTAGGGGYGNASERDPAAAKQDVEMGYVSSPQTNEDYPALHARSV